MGKAADQAAAHSVTIVIFESEERIDPKKGKGPYVLWARVSLSGDGQLILTTRVTYLMGKQEVVERSRFTSEVEIHAELKLFGIGLPPRILEWLPTDQRKRFGGSARRILTKKFIDWSREEKALIRKVTTRP